MTDINPARLDGRLTVPVEHGECLTCRREWLRTPGIKTEVLPPSRYRWIVQRPDGVEHIGPQVIEAQTPAQAITMIATWWRTRHLGRSP